MEWYLGKPSVASQLEINLEHSNIIEYIKVKVIICDAGVTGMPSFHFTYTTYIHPHIENTIHVRFHVMLFAPSVYHLLIVFVFSFSFFLPCFAYIYVVYRGENRVLTMPQPNFGLLLEALASALAGPWHCECCRWRVMVNSLGSANGSGSRTMSPLALSLVGIFGF